MEENKVHFGHLIFWKGKNATQATNKIYAVYGEGALAERTVRSDLLGLKLMISTLKIKNSLHHRWSSD